MLRLLTVKEVAELLGIRVETVYQKINSGKLPAYKVGRVQRVHPDDVAGLLKPVLDSSPPAPLFFPVS